MVLAVVVAMTFAACTDASWGGDTEARRFTPDAGAFPELADVWDVRVREAIADWNARLADIGCAPAFLIGPAFPARLYTPEEWVDEANVAMVFDGAADPSIGVAFRLDPGAGLPSVAIIEHELGHTLGLEHEQQSGPGSIMTPLHGPAITDADLARVAALRGCD